MVLDNFLHDRQTKSGSILFSKTDKRMKQTISNRLCDPRAIIGDRDRDCACDFARGYFYLPPTGGAASHAFSSKL